MNIINSYLKEFGATSDFNGRNGLHYSSELGTNSFQVILSLFHELNNKGAINKQDRDGKTPLHIACMHGHLNIIEEMIMNSTDFDIKLDIVDNYNKKPVHYLLEPIDMDLDGRYKQLCFELAMRTNDTEVLEELDWRFERF